ncbi:hypothetical protein EVAR_99588_1 [Eumeta japonica]|uniref:Uncharacterized protein n=1 Tax=Eumeta variegata TaxID=151549 RepID=A0A4C1ZKB1_EUMVA|nr:hypothetical protein EVAR_99588_1 [Eumeta japonica]
MRASESTSLHSGMHLSEKQKDRIIKNKSRLNYSSVAESVGFKPDQKLSILTKGVSAEVFLTRVELNNLPSVSENKLSHRSWTLSSLWRGSWEGVYEGRKAGEDGAAGREGTKARLRGPARRAGGRAIWRRHYVTFTVARLKLDQSVGARSRCRTCFGAVAVDRPAFG